MEDPRYPIGPFRPEIDEATPPEARDRALGAAQEAIAALPGEFALALEGLSEPQLDTPYREGGWTVRQLAHHVADSHVNAYVRLRWALTEDWPLIKVYEEKRWAALPDVRTVPVGVSLALLASLHTRWAALLRSLTPADWNRGYHHPENGPVTLARMTEMYSWHGRHHTAHVLRLRARLG